ncbi:Ras GTPase activating protein ira2 [Balamuthia mandrillaris]
MASEVETIAGSLASSPSYGSAEEHTKYEEIVAHMMAGIEVKNRKWRLRTYKQCFIGAEAVDWMVLNLKDIVKNRSEAVRLGKKLVAMGYIMHVTDGHNFEDEYFFYRFLSASQDAAEVEQRRRSVSLRKAFRSRASTSLKDVTKEKEKEKEQAEEDASGRAAEGPTDDGETEKESDEDLPRNAPTSGRSYTILFDPRALNMEELKERMFDPHTGVSLQDRKWRLHTYRNCFVGSECVEWLASYLNVSRATATAVGGRMMALGYFRHVVNLRPFRDKYYFYTPNDIDKEGNLFITLISGENLWQHKNSKPLYRCALRLSEKKSVKSTSKFSQYSYETKSIEWKEEFDFHISADINLDELSVKISVMNESYLVGKAVLRDIDPEDIIEPHAYWLKVRRKSKAKQKAAKERGEILVSLQYVPQQVDEGFKFKELEKLLMKEYVVGQAIYSTLLDPKKTSTDKQQMADSTVASSSTQNSSPMATLSAAASPSASASASEIPTNTPRATFTAERDTIATSLLNIFHWNCQILPLMQYALAYEIQNTENKSLLFRNESMAQILVGHFSRLVGSEYLQRVLRPLIKKLLAPEMEIEVDPTKLEGETLKKNQARLRSTCEAFLQAIFNNLNKIPSEFREICFVLQIETKKKFPTLLYRVIGGFFFLRFLCPAIVTPDAWDIIDGPLDAKQRRRLVLVAKVLQNLSNEVLFTTKQSYLTAMNDFVEEYTPRLHDFYDQLVSINERRYSNDIPEDNLGAKKNEKNLDIVAEYLLNNMEVVRQSIISLCEDETDAEQITSYLNHVLLRLQMVNKGTIVLE